MSGIYLHIPFCKQACHYCDFHFSTDSSSSQELADGMVTELILQKTYLQDSITTIYFGGGTPSLFSKKQIDLLLNTIQKNYSIAANPEITLEANPDDLSKEKLKELRESGINRLSVGVQSFDNGLLRFLNRAHDSTSAIHCLTVIKEAGFSNVSIDLIYAIPGLSENIWEETLATALSFSPQHISSYALAIEERTVFGNWVKRGKLHPMEEEPAAQQFEMLIDILSKNGYEQYEISNFCKPGFYSKHNSSYWKGATYLGIGPSAHSYNGDSRQFNVRNNARYLRMINTGEDPFEKEILTRENRINEYILTTLRTSWGCDLNFLKKSLTDDLLVRKKEYLQTLRQEGIVSIDQKNILLLTEKGKLVADKITEDLMV